MELCEVEMLGEESLVSIVPTFAESTIHLISGDIGPLEPGVPIQVPLSVALYLKRRHKCRIQAPDWLNTASLEQLLKTEQDGPLFAEIPERMMEIATLLIRHASDDIHDGDQIKLLLKDLWNTREAKVGKDVASFVRDPEQNIVRVENLTQMEVHRIRDSLFAALRVKKEIKLAQSASKKEDDASHNNSSRLNSTR